MISKYAVENQKWLKKDSYPKCTEPVFECKHKNCHKLGHKTLWIHKPIQTKIINDKLHYLADVIIKHAHFIENKDTGRHVEHYTGVSIWLDEDKTYKTIMVKKRVVPDYVNNITYDL